MKSFDNLHEHYLEKGAWKTHPTVSLFVIASSVIYLLTIPYYGEYEWFRSEQGMQKSLHSCVRRSVV